MGEGSGGAVLPCILARPISLSSLLRAKELGYLRGPQWESYKELDCFTGDPTGFRKQRFPSNFFAERNTALGHGQDTHRCVRRKHMETDQDRKTGMNSSPRDLGSLASDTQTLPVHGPERVFLVLT